MQKRASKAARALPTGKSILVFSWILMMIVAAATPPAAGQEDSRSAAAQAFSQGRYSEAAALYRDLVAQDPEDGQLAFRLAHSLHMAGDFEGSITAHRKAAQFPVARSAALFNIACAHSRLGQVDEALEALEYALREGYDGQGLRTDSDLDAIRQDLRFAELLRNPPEPNPDAVMTRRRGGGPGRGLGEEPLTYGNLKQRLQREADQGFSGAVLVIRGNEIVFDQGYGMANREKGHPFTTDTIFGIGSSPIDFTKAGILLLAQQGKVDLDDAITRFFDNVPADKRAITLRHLMTGGSGLQDFHDLPSDRDPDHTYIDRDEAMRRIFAQELLFKPGEGDEHSHSAWGVLAAVIEIAGGKAYPEFTQEHIFGPAGMKDTGFFGVEYPEERVAVGYGDSSDGEINAPPYWGPTSWLVMGSGGQVSTLRDMYRFYQAMRGHRILDAEWTEEFFEPESVLAGGDAYGFEIVYTQGPDDLMYVATNGGRSTRFERLARQLAGLVMGRGPGAMQGTRLANFPEAVQGQRAQGFFDALAQDDPQEYVRFGRENRPRLADQESVDAERARQHGEFRDMWGDLTVLSIVDGGNRLRVSARASDGGYRDFSFTFGEEPPHLIESIGIDRGSNPGVPALTEERWSSLEDLVEAARESMGVPALAVAVTRNGKIVASAADGVRRAGGDDAVEKDDRYHWGSVTKSVTGTMIGRLMQGGALRADLTLARAFPDWEIDPALKDVTLEQLMCHRGGIAAFTNFADLTAMVDHADDPVAVRASFLRRLVQQPPETTPGTAQKYSNAGIALAAHMAEVRAGRSWEQLVREYVFEPAGMKTAGFGWPRTGGDDQPWGHSSRGDGFEAMDDGERPFSGALDPAGNVHSSIEDMARYALVHLDGLAGRKGALKPETVQRIHTPLPGPGESYAFGWGIEEWPQPGSVCHWHNGSGGTYFADLRLLPEQDVGIAILMNGVPEGPMVREIGEAILNDLDRWVPEG